MRTFSRGDNVRLRGGNAENGNYQVMVVDDILFKGRAEEDIELECVYFRDGILERTKVHLDAVELVSSAKS